MCALLPDVQGCDQSAKDKSSQDSKNDSSNGSRPNTFLAGGSKWTTTTEAAQNLLAVIRAFEGAESAHITWPTNAAVAKRD